MMELDLDDFTAAVAARGAQWQAAGVQWQLHHGPTRSKSSAWVECTTAHHLAQLIVWTSGEADLAVGDISTGSITITHYEMSNATEIATCLDDLTQRLTGPRLGLDESHRDTPRAPGPAHASQSSNRARPREPPAQPGPPTLSTRTTGAAHPPDRSRPPEPRTPAATTKSDVWGKSHRVPLPA